MTVYIVAHDVGTTGCKSALVDRELNVVRRVTVPYETCSPRTGWAEQNPDDWWHAVCTATKQLVHGIDVLDIASVSVTGQMMGCLPVAKNGRSLYPCITWADQRSAAQLQDIERTVGLKHMHEITGQPVSSGYTLPKILWLREHEPSLYAETHVFLLTKDYINYRLTGCFATDHTDATYTLCYDVKAATWSSEILESLDINREVLPEIRDSASVLGVMHEAALSACGLPARANIPVIVGAGDGSVAHAGALCFDPGDAYLSLGSSSWYMQVTESLSCDENAVLHCEPHILPQRFMTGGTMQTGGLAYQWLKESFFGDRFEHKMLDNLVKNTRPLAGGTLFFPFLQGERSPWVNSNLRGAFFNVGLQTLTGNAVRAVLEGVMFNLLSIKQRCAGDTNPDLTIIGGGAVNGLWCQMIADAFDKTVFVPEFYRDAGSIGSAVLSLMASNDLPDLRTFKDNVRGTHYTPNRESTEQYEAAHSLWLELAEYHLRQTPLLTAYRRLAEQE